MDDQEVIEVLRSSGRHFGRLYPVLLDKHGNVIDGLHRLEADPNWPRIRLDHITSSEDRLVARLIANVCRRKVSAVEKSQMLEELGKLYIKAGVKPGAELARKISGATGMSFRWVMKYLPDKLKERPGAGGWSRRPNLPNVKEYLYTCKVAQHTTESFAKFLTAEPANRVLTIKKYTNTNFVQILLAKRFYEDVDRFAKDLGTTAEIIINNALIWAVRKLKESLSLDSCPS
ncbi:MAG: ParB/RepB/Spo0J family partition protein [Candidatus Bathyarchaeia archaeon]